MVERARAVGNRCRWSEQGDLNSPLTFVIGRFKFEMGLLVGKPIRRLLACVALKLITRFSPIPKALMQSNGSESSMLNYL